jgi:hypothetical protein
LRIEYVTVNGSALVTFALTMRFRSSCGAPSGPARNTEGSRSELSAVVMGLCAASECGL